MPVGQEKMIAWCAAGALIGYMWYMTQGQLVNVTVDPATLPDNQFDPFIHWRTSDPSDWVVPHPAAIGANCLPRILQTESIGLALTPEVDRASCAQ
jgi:hypothetical protein